MAFLDRRPALIALPLLLAACSGVEQPSQPDEAITPAPSPAPGPDGPPPGYTDGSGVNEGYPRLQPPVLTLEAERGETGARNVLLSFARAIELREYDQAWAMLGPGAKANWTKPAFNAAFADLARLTVAVPGGTMEGAAGSSYYNSTIVVTASNADGRPVRIEGPIVLRRINDVDGATAEQLRWHIESLALDVTH